MNIILDYNRTIFDPTTNDLYPGVGQLLADLSRRHRLYLVSQNEPSRYDRLQQLDIERYFVETAFVDEKNEKLFLRLIKDSHDVMVVGDSLSNEIAIGNRLGFITVLVRQSRFASPNDSLTPARHSIERISDLPAILSRYEK